MSDNNDSAQEEGIPPTSPSASPQSRPGVSFSESSDDFIRGVSQAASNLAESISDPDSTIGSFAQDISQGASLGISDITRAASADIAKRILDGSREYDVDPETYATLMESEPRMAVQQRDLGVPAGRFLLQLADKLRQVEQSQDAQTQSGPRPWKFPRGRQGVGYKYGPGGVSRRSPWRTKRMWAKAHRDWTLYDVTGIKPVNPRVRADAETNIIARRIFGTMLPTLRRMRTVPNAPYTADMIASAYRMSGLPSVEGIKARKLPKLAKHRTNSIDRVLADWRLAAPNVQIDHRSMRY